MKWISVEEQTPAIGQSVLVMDAYHNWYMVATINPIAGRFMPDNRGDHRLFIDTHWMPLPEPPETESEG